MQLRAYRFKLHCVLIADANFGCRTIEKQRHSRLLAIQLRQRRISGLLSSIQARVKSGSHDPYSTTNRHLASRMQCAILIDTQRHTELVPGGCFDTQDVVQKEGQRRIAIERLTLILCMGFERFDGRHSIKADQSKTVRLSDAHCFCRRLPTMTDPDADWLL